MSDKVREVYNRHAQSAAEDDFWTQSARTVRGVPIGEDQITMMVEAIAAGLNLAMGDTVLDLCCGNGALTDRVFARCLGGVGVDFAEHQLAVARRVFERRPERRFEFADVHDFVTTSTEMSLFTKAFSYGSFSYMSATEVFELLAALRTRFSAVQRVFIGNVPNRDAMGAFFYPGTYVPGIEDDHESPIGRWWSKREFSEVAARAGWSIAFHSMPPVFYAAHYRYDAVLTPLEETGPAPR